MVLRFVSFWILINSLITPFGSPVSRGTETVQIVSCISHVARYAPSPTFNLYSKTISKSNKVNL